MEKINIAWSETIDIKQIIGFLDEKRNELQQLDLAIENNQRDEIEDQLKQIRTAKELLLDYDSLLFHQHIARAQREAYNKHRSNVDELRNKILIEIDFKEQIVIGLRFEI